MEEAELSVTMVTSHGIRMMRLKDKTEGRGGAGVGVGVTLMGRG